MTTRRLAPIVGVLGLLCASARAEGPGIKLGESLVLHPGLAAGVGYDSNVFFASTNETGAAYVNVRPHVDVSTLSLQRGGDTPHTLDFRLHLGTNIRVLVGNPSILRNYSVDVDSGFVLSLFPFGRYSFDLFDNYIRTSVPPYRATGSVENINTHQNQLGMRFAVRPGGNRLEIGLQYIFGFYLFERNDPTVDYTTKNNVTNDFQLRISWKFFPKTALYLQAQESPTNYITDDPLLATGQGSRPPDAFPLRVVFGMIGLITAKLSVNANIGYANSFTGSNANYPMSRSFSMAIGQIEGTWKPVLTTAIALGYRYDFQQALIGTFFELNQAHLSLTQLIWRVTAVLRFSYEMRAYQGRLTNDSLADGRLDHVLTGHLELNLPIKDWFYLSVGDDLQRNFSNCQLRGAAGPLPCDYFRNDVWLRLGVAY